MEIHLVADTNLFFEFRTLEELPWQELGYDTVVIILTKPVLDEIDKHKKSTGRTRSRALEIFARIREMLTARKQEADIRSSAPRVILRRMASALPDLGLKYQLDYGKPDERLIGIVSTLNARAVGYDVKLFTDDGGPAGIADDLGIPFLMINQDWRRPPAESPEAKRVRELEKDLALYRAQEPKIVIRCETADSANKVRVVRKVAQPLSEAQIETFVDDLRHKHPQKADFTPPPTSTRQTTLGEVETIEYSAPSNDEIADYVNARYPQWIENCRNVLRSVHVGRDEVEPEVFLGWSLLNEGTRPASQVRLEFEAKGPLELLRLRAQDDDDDVGAEAPTESPSPAAPCLPPAPKPPAFGQRVTRTQAPVPSVPKLPSSFDIATIKSATELHKQFASAASAAKLLGLDRLSDPGYLKSINSASELVKRWSDPNLLAASRLDSLVTPHSFATVTPHTIEQLRIPRAFTPEPHDPEAFYFDDWPRGRPVTKGALTCDLWRHRAADKFFEFEILFENDDEAQGAVECTVHADNLTKPERAIVTINRVFEPLSMVGLAKSLVDACR
jgi:hypothetical protein